MREADTGSRLIEGFLRRAGRRLLLRRLLGGCLWSGLAGLGCAGLVSGVNKIFSWRLPVIDIALPLLAVFATRALLRARLPRAALEADRELMLQDRLASFLDFQGRGDVDPEMRKAQVRETATRLGPHALGRALRIPAPYRLGPFVLLGALATTSLSPWLTRVRIPGTGRPHPMAERASQGRSVEKNESDRPVPSREEENERPGEAAAPVLSAKPAAGVGEPQRGAAEVARREADVPKPTAGSAPGPEHARTSVLLEEPAYIYSETVTPDLTPVASGAPPRREGVSSPPPPWSGRISFHLAPAASRGKDGERGEGAAGGPAPAEISIDFSRIPPDYREYVRRYFERLQGAE